MKTVAQHWHGFERAVIPATAGRTQRTEMRRAFYAGFFAALMAGLQMAEETGDDDDLGAERMQELHDECLRFSKDVEEGRA